MRKKLPHVKTIAYTCESGCLLSFIICVVEYNY